MASISNLFGRAINAADSLLSVTDIVSDAVGVTTDYVSEYRIKREASKSSRLEDFAESLAIERGEARNRYLEKVARIQLRREQLLSIGDTAAAIQRFEEQHGDPAELAEQLLNKSKTDK